MSTPGSAKPTLRLLPERPFEQPIYSRRYLTMMCMLLNVKSSQWFSEFEEVYRKCPGIELPALLRRDYIQLRRNEPVEPSAVYESIALKPKSLEEADLIILDDGSTISVNDELTYYDLFDDARHRWGWLGATAAKAYIAIRRRFTARHTLPSSDDDAPLSQTPVQSVASSHEFAHDSSDLRRRHKSPCS
ncbi:hypothetical protein RTBOTA2_005137 [Rhodotorula toruloides]|nr:hypothetical protein RTBOTA2_005137 [Rhodotorula toruloides]